jgi:hypothetical protein
MAAPWERYQQSGPRIPMQAAQNQSVPSGPWDRYRQSENGGALNYAAAPFAGFNRGLGFPVDLVNAPLRALGVGSEKPIGGSEWMAETFNRVPVPDTAAGQFLERTGEEVGASVLPAGVITKAAQIILKPARSLLGRVWGAFANPIRRAPGRAAVGELVAATGAGAGGATAEQLAPGNRGAETVGQLIGGVAPGAVAFTPSALVTRAVRTVTNRFSSQGQARQAREAVSGMLGETLTPEARQALTDADKLRQEIPGFDPTLGEATGSPALIASQRRVERSATGADLERLTARREGSEAAIEHYAAEGGPQGEGGPAFIIDTANQRVESLRRAIGARQADTTAARTELAESIPRTDRAEIGKNLRERLERIRTDTRKRLNRRADELGINDVDLTVPFGEFSASIETEFAPKSVFEDAANTPAIVNLLRGERDFEKVTFADIKALRERISDDLIDALGNANPNRRSVRALTLLRERLDGFIKGIGDEAFGGAAARWRQFREEYFNDYIKRFEDGAAFRVRKRDERGFYRTPNEQVASTFFAPRSISAARQFKVAFGNDAEANAALEAVALDSLRDVAVRDGVIKPVYFRMWLRRHESVLDELPEIKRAVQDIATADEGLMARQAQLAARAQSVEDQLLTRELNAFARGTRTGESVLDSVISDPRKMAQLVSVLRQSREAMNALRRNVWDKATAADAPGIMKFINDHRDSLGFVFDQQHFKALENVVMARVMLERVPAQGGAAYVPRPLEDVERMIGQGLPQLSSRLFALKSGRMQKGYLMIDTLMRGLRGRAASDADDMLRVALYDPEVARMMAETVQRGSLNLETAKRLQARLFALGLPYVDERDRPAQEAEPTAVQESRVRPAQGRQFAQSVSGPPQARPSISMTRPSAPVAPAPPPPNLVDPQDLRPGDVESSIPTELLAEGRKRIRETAFARPGGWLAPQAQASF